MQINVRLTALFALRAGASQLSVTLAENGTLADLMQAIEAQFGVMDVPVYFMVNGKMEKALTAPLVDGSDVTVLMASGLP